jgi:ABC-type transport system substrate-binding protein
MRRLILIAALGALLAACSAPTPAPAALTLPEPVSADPPTATPIPHAEALRLALVGAPTEVNAWALFDEAGANYANYALHDGEYPRLARLSIPAREVEPYVAESIPAVTAEGNFMAASVRLRPGLQWSDGSPLTARDIVFTVETAQAFQLQLDWSAAYPPDLLERVEAVDDRTVKFHFNGPIHTGNWQYGVLQGPILSHAYWSSKLAPALGRLPTVESTAALNELKARAAELQSYIDVDNAQLQVAVPGSADAASLTARITRNQNDLNSVHQKLSRAQDEYDAALAAARAALFALDDEGEPTFGPFLRARRDGNTFTREANPLYPFEAPNYDRAVYTLYDGFAEANQALAQSDANVLLSASGAGQEANAPSHPTSSARFLVFNPRSQGWSGRALRTALACLLDKQAMLSGQEWAYDGFLLPGPWQEGEPRLACAGQSSAGRIREAARLLKEAGYTWAQEPTPEQAGAGLKLPDGSDFPPAVLLTTTPEYDLWRANAGVYIETQARSLGIPLVRQEVDSAALRYAVYSSGEYDLAILGWQLSEHPGYLCEWFGQDGPFGYADEKITSACLTLRGSADLDAARGAARMLQTVLLEDLPFIPLYLRQGFDGRRQVAYPFGSVLNGLSGLYGAPVLAIPAP